jgi:hypothetical protein
LTNHEGAVHIVERFVLFGILIGARMAWRVIEADENVWHVQPAAEKRANQTIWQLMLSFRQKTEERPTVFWAPFPIESASKSSLFHQADSISDQDLRDLIAEHAG